MTLSPLGDSAGLLTVGEGVSEATAARVRAAVTAIARRELRGVTDVVGAFASVAVFYDPLQAGGLKAWAEALEGIAAEVDAAAGEQVRRLIEVPVVYGGESGPDLDAVAAHTKLAPDEVVALHSAAEYLVHAIGFAPGFPYLGGLPPELATPRRATPRTRVPAGTVGIGGMQTGVYPLATPGGWNLIGRTPLALFDVHRMEPALLRTGDRVQFKAIGEEEFARLAALEEQSRRGNKHGAAAVPASDIEVVRAGALTTVQDRGRVGHRANGVPLSGAADAVSLRVANLLVGNADGAAGLEFTLTGPDLRFARDAVVALGGGDFGLPRWRPILVRAGETLRLGHARTGCRGYLAVAGGIDVAPTLGSRSTYLRGGLGGLEGRALREGDRLPAPLVRRETGDHWRIDERVLPEYSTAPTLRIVHGAHAGDFGGAWLERDFRVTPQADRMGVRLEGTPLVRADARELVSTPAAPGTVQVPPDGQPIVLLADAQTIGGYPQIGHVITADLPLAAQLRPGDTVRFRAVSLEEAHAVLHARERALGILREGIAQKLA